MKQPLAHVLTALALLAPALHAHAADEPLNPTAVLGIQLERTACLGPCPVYTVDASRDGAVAFRGVAHVARIDRQAGHIGAQDFAFLANAAAHVGFMSLQGSYVSLSDGCEDLVTDAPSIKITVRLADRARTVHYYRGCNGPAELSRIAWLADTIDEMTGAAQWVGKR